MADKRINALATTASSTASDDFIAVDGTTNGTRKLNAFSPTFGGNATVTGTLTGNSTITGANLISSVNSGAANGSEFTAFSALVGTDASLGPCRINIGALPSATFGSRYGYIACYDSGDYRKLYLGGSPGIAATGGQILIPATIASTTTSTGALVVSGGVGVAGAIYAGGNITIDKAAPDFTLVRSANTNGGLIQLATSTTYDFAIGLRNTTDSDLHIYNYGTSNDALKIARATSAVTLNSTTASTSTSSGALVVSGGVGVAGAIYVGGYASTASHARIGASGSVVALSAANNVDSGLPAAWNGNYGLGVYYSAASTNTILMGDGSAGTTIFATRTGSANTSRITIDNTNGNTTFAGAISIGNTVNTVSPTSPNRTITMVIGGTTYYLAAKTTND